MPNVYCFAYISLNTLVWLCLVHDSKVLNYAKWFSFTSVGDLLVVCYLRFSGMWLLVDCYWCLFTAKPTPTASLRILLPVIEIGVFTLHFSDMFIISRVNFWKTWLWFGWFRMQAFRVLNTIDLYERLNFLCKLAIWWLP